MNESGPENIGISQKSGTVVTKLNQLEREQSIVLCIREESDWSKSKKTRISINEWFNDSIFSSPTVLFSIFSLIVSIIFPFL